MGLCCQVFPDGVLIGSFFLHNLLSQNLWCLSQVHREASDVCRVFRTGQVLQLPIDYSANMFLVFSLFNLRSRKVMVGF